MVFDLRSLVVWDVSTTTDGSAFRPSGRNPRLRRKANTALTLSASHTGQTTSRDMMTFIVLILSCSSLFGAEADIRIVTSAKTNAERASISTKDMFTRAGQTNLVRNTKTKAGVVQIRIHRFYHAGLLVGDFVATPNSSFFTTEAGSPYSVSFEFGPSKDVKSATIGTKDGGIIDAFTCTNGVFSPVESSLITKANSIGSDVQELLSPEHAGKTSPDDFGRKVEKLIEKHKDK